MGSEMCIRDRGRDGRRLPELRIPIPPRLAGARPWLRSTLLPRTCLLYTSDAADERSSVDLGGRRIIKKKNNRVTSESDSPIS